MLSFQLNDILIEVPLCSLTYSIDKLSIESKNIIKIM